MKLKGIKYTQLTGLLLGMIIVSYVAFARYQRWQKFERKQQIEAIQKSIRPLMKPVSERSQMKGSFNWSPKRMSRSMRGMFRTPLYYNCYVTHTADMSLLQYEIDTVAAVFTLTQIPTLEEDIADVEWDKTTMIYMKMFIRTQKELFESVNDAMKEDVQKQKAYKAQKLKAEARLQARLQAIRQAIQANNYECIGLDSAVIVNNKDE